MSEPARQKIPHLAADASTSMVGRELKEAREALGITVPEMAQTLRIRTVHIEALEEGRFDELPGRPYTLGFARSMARHLGLDADTVAMRLRDEVMGTAPAVELVFPESTEDKRLSRTGWIVISLVLAIIAYGAWLAVGHRSEAPPEFAAVQPPLQVVPESIAPQPEQTPEIGAPDTSSATPSDTATAEAPSVPQAVETAPAAASPSPIEAKPQPAASAPPVVATKTTPAPSTSTVTPPAASRRPATGAAPSAQPADEDQEDVTPEPSTIADGAASAPTVHVLLRASQDSWIQIQAADGATVVARTLRAGDTYAVPDLTGLKLTTGNAGGLDVIVDGRAIPPLGQPGTVRRDVALDPARLKAGTALQ